MIRVVEQNSALHRGKVASGALFAGAVPGTQMICNHVEPIQNKLITNQ
jgi:hypothetical protein